MIPIFSGERTLCCTVLCHFKLDWRQPFLKLFGIGWAGPVLLNKVLASGSFTVTFIMERVLFMISLVIFLSCIEWGRRKNLRGDRFIKPAALCQRKLRLFRFGPLVFIMIKNGCPVGVAPVMELSPCIGRVNLLPEQLQQFLVRKHGRIKCNLHSLIVAGLIGTDLLISRILRMSSGISRDDPMDPREFFKRRHHTPETASGKGSEFQASSLR